MYSSLYTDSFFLKLSSNLRFNLQPLSHNPMSCCCDDRISLSLRAPIQTKETFKRPNMAWFLSKLWFESTWIKFKWLESELTRFASDEAQTRWTTEGGRLGPIRADENLTDCMMREEVGEINVRDRRWSRWQDEERETSCDSCPELLISKWRQSNIHSARWQPK